MNMSLERDMNIMIFVRVPKTGSYMMNNLIGQLALMNNYTAFWKTRDMPEKIQTEKCKPHPTGCLSTDLAEVSLKKESILPNF